RCTSLSGGLTRVGGGRGVAFWRADLPMWALTGPRVAWPDSALPDGNYLQGAMKESTRLRAAGRHPRSSNPYHSSGEDLKFTLLIRNTPARVKLLPMNGPVEGCPIAPIREKLRGNPTRRPHPGSPVPRWSM